MRLPHFLLAVLVVVASTAVTLGVLAAVDDEPRRRVAPPVAPEEVVADPAAPLEVLRRWDRRRADAWAAADVNALRALYTQRSRAGERDAAMLQRWISRGLTVRGMQTQMLSVTVSVEQAERMVLVVTDRLSAGVAVGRGQRVRLPSDRPSTRRVTLRRQGGAWRVEAVRQV